MRTRTSRLSYFLILTGIVGLVMMADGMGLTTSVDNRLSEQRMDLAPRPAGGEVVLVGIDKKSLDGIGIWPWPRATYATMIDRLVDAGARDIFFDIDFSSASDPVNDQLFLEALKRAGGNIVLPTFRQQISVSDSKTTGINGPNPMFLDHAWLASVNISPDADGVVRRFPYDNGQAGGAMASVPATFTGDTDPGGGNFIVDFSIDPATVPMVSAVDLINGSTPAEAFADKIVVIGASAIELKDNFNVPVHGLISGPMLQIIATETLLQQRALRNLANWPLLLFAMAIGSVIILSRWRMLRYVTLLVATAMAAETIAYWLQTVHGLVLPTAGSHFLLALFAATRVLRELDFRKLRIRVVSTDASNSRSILDQVLADSADALLIVDENWKILMSNQRFHQLLAGSDKLSTGDIVRDCLPGAWVNAIAAAIDALQSGKQLQPSSAEVIIGRGRDTQIVEYSVTPSRLSHVDGDDSQAVHSHFAVCVTARDITERRRDEDRIFYLSRHDVLTGALRASAFIDELDARMPHYEGSELGFPVFAVNLHRFKTINSTLGRAKGDVLLKAVVRRINGLGLGLAPAGRLGGDTFALYPADPLDLAASRQLAQQLMEALSASYEIAGFKARLGVHIGMTFKLSGHCSTAAEAVSEAELALDFARKTSGNGLALYDPAMGSRHSSNSEIESELWRALEKREISVLYQPQVEIADRRFVGAEALIRWTHPRFGVVSPGVFIEIAEANGFVEQLGNWVLMKACEDAMGWNEPLSVAVNVSPLQFLRGDIVAEVAHALKASGLPAERLQIEITESTFLNHSDLLISKLKALKALGVSLALDDFGTGYSSFAYLAMFPLDKIKVDQMFIRTLLESSASRAVLRSVKALADGLGIGMLCEGIEDEAELEYLQKLGCDQGQGYLFGKPITSEALCALVAQSRASARTATKRAARTRRETA